MVSEGETEMKLGARGAAKERQLDVDVVGARVNRVEQYIGVRIDSESEIRGEMGLSAGGMNLDPNADSTIGFGIEGQE